jgi:hypothetical protein
MSPSFRSRRLQARTLVVAAGAALVLLTACNPLTRTATPTGAGHASAAAGYAGPAGAWLEVAVAGTDGYDVRYEVAIWLGRDGARTCRDATTGAVEPCQLVDAFVVSDTYPATAARRATISPLDGDEIRVLFTCRQGGAIVTCPTLRVELRTVDGDGDLIGDLR